MTSHKDSVVGQFQKSADGYVTSPIHAKGSDLPLLGELAGLDGTQAVLDVATGVGHAAFALAPTAREVVGVDLTPAMIEAAAQGARERGLGNVRFLVSDVDALPFPSEAFDVVTCRIAAHHFSDMPAALREMGRVLKSGGKCILIDNYVPENSDLDLFINQIEQLRDPSHVRAYNLAEWELAFHNAGMGFQVAHTFTTPIAFDWWVGNAKTPPDQVAQLRTRFADATPETGSHFAIRTEPELQFALQKVIIVGVKPHR